MRRSRGGFTLIELLVVIAIIGILIGLLLPAVQKVREAANRMKCSNNVKQVVLGLHNYHDTNNCLPPGVSQQLYTAYQGYDRRGWTYFLLPFIEQASLYNQMEAAWGSAGYSTFLPGTLSIIPSLMCPSDAANPKTVTHFPGQGFHGNYVLCGGDTYFTPGGADGTSLDGVFYAKSKTRFADITDGTSNTLFASELILSPDSTSNDDVRGRYHNAIHTGVLFSTIYPPNNSVGDNPQTYCVAAPMAPCTGAPGTSNAFNLARSYHPGGVNAGLGDGAVRFISNAVTPSVYQALGTRAGGETPADY